jgi:hypothetical protein
MRKEKMLVARIFSCRRRASASTCEKNQLEQLPIPCQTRRHSTRIQLEFNCIRISSDDPAIPCSAAQRSPPIRPMQSSQINPDDPATALPVAPWRPRQKNRGGGEGGLRACLDDAGIIPESRYIRKEKMPVARIFLADAAQVLQPVTRIRSSGLQFR